MYLHTNHLLPAGLQAP